MGQRSGGRDGVRMRKERNKRHVLTDLRGWYGTGWDTKTKLARGCLWTERKQASKGSSLAGESRCTAGNGMALGGWRGPP